MLIGTLADLDEYNAAMVIELLESDKQLEEEILEELTSRSRAARLLTRFISPCALVESRNFFSKEVEADIVKLLQAKDFFVARRASEFLSKQKLSASAKRDVGGI